MDLRYDMLSATKAGDSRHPQKVMRELGITYTHAIPQSLGDQWWFANCKNVPEVLPVFLKEMRIEANWIAKAFETH